MTHRSDPANEKRRSPRVSAEHRVRLKVSLHGFDDAEGRYEARGVTINLSRGGALVRVDKPVASGTRCLLHLPGGELRIGRSLIYGSVRRSRAIEEAFEIAIEFHTRLQSLSFGGSGNGA